MLRSICPALLFALFLSFIAFGEVKAEELSMTILNGTGPGWLPLGADDFTRVNCDESTWIFEGNLIKCTGQPVGVIRTKQTVKNLEILVEWRHLEYGGNSGIFLWAPIEALTDLPPNSLPPGGIEIQMLDLGYADLYTKRTGKAPDWFTSHGDIFPVGKSTMTPFPPLSPNGNRSFPTENRSKPVNQWNQYYVRAINGEVRLWVNGKEVSGGNNCVPAEGHLCLESEGAPVEFRDLRIRELP